MKRGVLMFTCVVALSYRCPCHGANPAVAVAVMELGANNVAPGDVAGLTNRLRTNLFATGAYTVLERAEMDEILREQGFQQTGCTDASCAVQVGQLVGVQKMVVGSVDRVGQTYSVTVRLVDVATGQIERSVAVDCDKCAVEEVLKRTMSEAAYAIAGLKAPTQSLQSAEVVRWSGHWRGVYTYTGYTVLVGTISAEMCLDLSVDSGRVTGFGSLNCNGRHDPRECPVTGSVDGTTIVFNTTVRSFGSTFNFDFRGTYAGGQISGSFVQRTRGGDPKPGTWTATRDTTPWPEPRNSRAGEQEGVARRKVHSPPGR